MNEKKAVNYIFITSKLWHIKEFNKQTKKISGNWYLFQNLDKKNLDQIFNLNPKFIFFPHWSHKVSKKLIETFDCVCFHETDLPFGRGGSPIQNLIVNGYKTTFITALKMDENFDSGPIYLKKPLSLLGSAEEIYLNSASIMFEMIVEIIDKKIIPKPQRGNPTYFKRRKLYQSEIPKNLKTLEEFYDFIRMLDAHEYPSAFLELGNFKISFKNASRRISKIESLVEITKIKKD
tara:strand:+ start:2084 stop:2785 length:702 start_codon:yes stop_codon:yes gene_type:complete